jgi:hypothetical protein
MYHPVGVLRHLFIMGNRDDGYTAFTDVCELREDPVAGLTIQVSSRFVGEDEPRLVHECSGDGDPLPLPSRQFVWPMVESVTQTDLVEERRGPLGCLRVAVQQLGDLYVLLRGQRRNQVELLEHEPDCPSAQARSFGVRETASWVTVEIDVTAGRYVE